MKLFFLSAFAWISISASAQWNHTFESLNLPPAGFYNGADLAGGFSDNGLFFPNRYDSQFNFWSGFAASGLGDTLSAGFGNQYSTFAGVPSSGNTFALGYGSGGVIIRNATPATGRKLVSFRYTNSTYAALSMKNGDAFSKKFGGPTGNDPDFFRMKIINYKNGLRTDSAEVYLADYRFPNGSQDYIVKDWRQVTVDFSSPFDSLGFELTSSDVGNFGMNTPAYFCLDDIQTNTTTQVSKALPSSFRVFPNPASDLIFWEGAEGATLSIIRADGVEIQNGISAGPVPDSFRISALPPGVYFLRSTNGEALPFIHR